MASFLGAAAQGGAPVLLARSVPVSLASTAAQAITLPAGCVPMFFVLRAGLTAWSTTGSFALGVTTTLSSLISTKVATSLPTTIAMVNSLFTSGTTSVCLAVGTSTIVYFNMVQIEPTATQSFVDIIGYVY